MKNVANAIGVGGSGGLVGAIAGLSLGLGVQGVQAAADFQSAMTKVQVLAAPASENIKAMGDAVLHMATDVGKSPTDLANGLYFVESAGFHGKQALDILRLSAETASIAMVDTKVVADGLTTSLAQYGSKGLTAARATDIMTATVSAGKMEYADYVNVLGKLTVSASTAHIGFTEANAALATFTQSGFNAHIASQYLSNTFTQLDLKTDKIAANAKKMHIAFDESRFKSMSLAQQIEYLNTITKGNDSAVLKLFSSNSIAAKSYAVLRDHIVNYKQILNQLNHSQGQTAAAWAATQGTFNQSMARLKASMDVLLITIGNLFLPLATKGINLLVPLIGSLAGAFVDLNSIVSNKVYPMFTTLGTYLYFTFSPIVRALSTEMNRLLDVIAYYMVLALRNLEGSLYSTSIAMRSLFLPAFGAMHAQISLAVPALHGLGDTFGQIFAQLESNFAGMLDSLKQDFNHLFELFDTLRDKYGPSALLLIGGIALALKELATSPPPDFGAIFQTRIVKPLETLYDQVMTFLKPVILWWNNVMGPALQEASGGFQHFGDAITQYLIPAMIGINEHAGQLIQSDLPTLLDTFERLAPPVVRLAGMIAGALGDAIQFLSPYIEQAANAILDFANSIIMTILPALGALGDQLTFFENNELPFFMWVFQQLAPFFQGMWQLIQGLFQMAFANIKTVFLLWLDALTGNWSKFGNDFIQGVMDWGTGFTNVYYGIGQELSSITQGIGIVIVTDWNGTVQLIVTQWENLPPQIKAILLGMADTIVSIFQGIKDQTTSIVDGMVHGITGAFQGMYDTLVGHSIVPDMNDGIVASFTDMGSKVSSLTSKLASNVTEAMSTMKDTGYKDVSSFTEQTITMFQKMGDYGQQIMQSLDQNTIGYWNDIAQYITDHPINANIQTSISGDSHSTAAAVQHFNNSRGLQTNLGAYASGGINLPAGWALVGEKGPELMYVPGGSNIYPLTGGSSAGSFSSGGGFGGTNVVLNVNITARPQDEAEMEQIARYLIAYLGDQIRAQFGNV